jgi:long-chain fatty acid transport protein
VRQRHRVPMPRVFLTLAILGLLVSSPALPSGFQVMTHGARAAGMGLAYAGMSGDPTTIFFNPAGMAWVNHFEGYVGVNFLTRTEGQVVGANPYPGEGSIAYEEQNWYFFPDGYAVVPLTADLNFGLGGFAQYGLGLKWQDPNTTYNGQFISQNAVIQSLDTNAVFSYKLLPQLSIAAGVDYRFSKVQLERNVPGVDPFTGAVVPVAHVKLNSELLSNGGWGYNAGIMYKPIEEISIGAAYRSAITIDYDGTATFTPRPTGNAVLDALVAAGLPTGTPPVQTSIHFPSSINLGAAIGLGGGFLLALEADWTEWSTFQSLAITFPTLTGRDILRPTLWQDSWAYRAGLEKSFGAWAIRVGYYYDNTPQPDFDVSPLLPDADRNVYTAGFGYNTERWGFDVGALLIKFKERSILTPPQTDNYFGTYSETGLVLTAGIRLAL